MTNHFNQLYAHNPPHIAMNPFQRQQQQMMMNMNAYTPPKSMNNMYIANNNMTMNAVTNNGHVNHQNNNMHEDEMKAGVNEKTKRLTLMLPEKLDLPSNVSNSMMSDASYTEQTSSSSQLGDGDDDESVLKDMNVTPGKESYIESFGAKMNIGIIKENQIVPPANVNFE